MIRVGAVWLAVEPLDMRAGTEAALAKVVSCIERRSRLRSSPTCDTACNVASEGRQNPGADAVGEIAIFGNDVTPMYYCAGGRRVSAGT